MNARIPAAAAALTLAVGGCAGLRDDIRARPGPASVAFDAAELVDVLSPGTVPAVDRPAFESAALAEGWLEPADPVVALEIGGDARAYPLAILVWHEIVNDTVGGEPVAVTYAPLTNAAVVFRRATGGGVLSFAGSGKLYRSGLVMYDRASRSLWPQLGGAATLGPLEGAALERIPSQIASFGDWRAAFPSGKVLTRETGAARGYGATPYAGYDSRARPSDSFFAPVPDGRLAPMERVVAAGIRAYPYEVLRAAGGVLYDRNDAAEVVVLWRGGTRSPLDTVLIANGRDVGSAGVFIPIVDGRRLDLSPDPGGFRDSQTGSTWSVLGVATAGPLAGKRLAPVSHVDAFWFAWAASAPGTTIVGAS